MLLRDVAESLDVPRNYLSKICHRLAQGGVLSSVRGRGGGFTLGRPPEDITLREVIACVEPVDETASPICLLGRPSCTDEDPCAAHDAWILVRDRLDAFLRDTTVAKLARDSPPGSD